MAAGSRAPDKMPKAAPPLWSAEKYADVYGLKRPGPRGRSDAARKCSKASPATAGTDADRGKDTTAVIVGAGSSSSAGTQAVGSTSGGSNLTKNQRKKAKKREKKAAAAVAGPAADGTVTAAQDVVPAEGESDRDTAAQDVATGLATVALG